MSLYDVKWLGDIGVEVRTSSRSILTYRKIAQLVQETGCLGIDEVIPTSTALGLRINPDRFQIGELESTLSTIHLEEIGTNTLRSYEVAEIPICYSEEMGFDLKELSSRLDIDITEIIKIHHSSTYSVEMFGFLPGFPYMSGLPSELSISRKSKPNLSIPSGSVAIAGNQCGIYPFESPGGWYVIGRTPKKIMDLEKEPPFLLDTGMKVKFLPITLDQFHNYQ